MINTKPILERIEEKTKELFLLGVGLIFLIGIFYVTPMYVFDWGRCDSEKTVEILGGCSFFGKCGVGFTDQSFGTASRPVVGQKVCVQRSYLVPDESSFPLVAWRTYIRAGKKSDPIHALKTPDAPQIGFPPRKRPPTFEEWREAKKAIGHNSVPSTEAVEAEIQRRERIRQRTD